MRTMVGGLVIGLAAGCPRPFDPSGGDEDCDGAAGVAIAGESEFVFEGEDVTIEGDCDHDGVHHVDVELVTFDRRVDARVLVYGDPDGARPHRFDCVLEADHLVCDTLEEDAASWWLDGRFADGFTVLAIDLLRDGDCGWSLTSDAGRRVR